MGSEIIHALSDHAMVTFHLSFLGAEKKDEREAMGEQGLGEAGDSLLGEFSQYSQSPGVSFPSATDGYCSGGSVRVGSCGKGLLVYCLVEVGARW